MKNKSAFMLLTIFHFASASADNGLTVAVASNFQTTAKEIARRYSESTGVSVRVSAGSTGKLYAQIVHGAPYDVYLAADTERPRKLYENGLAKEDSYFVYASGYLVLWSNHPQYQDRDCMQDFQQGLYRHLAIANPRTAPYGAVAREYLENNDLWASAEAKLVYGENISQTFQFVASGNASLGLVAASQISNDIPHVTTCQHLAVDEGLAPYIIRQAGVVLANSKNPVTANDFMRFLQSPEIRMLIERSGYHASLIALNGEQ